MKKKYHNQKEVDIIIDNYIEFKAKKITTEIKKSSLHKNKKVCYV